MSLSQVRTALVDQLKELHLPAMRACFEETARRAEKQTLSYEQYLLELAERECEERRRRSRPKPTWTSRWQFPTT